jgi:cysteine desulfurase
VDAAAAAGHVPFDVEALGADLVSVSSHKLGGPAGVGALVVRRGLRIEPLLVGGEQERGRRAGLEDVVGAIGFGAAAATLSGPDRMASESSAARHHTDRMLEAAGRVTGVHPYGDTVRRVPHILCLGVDGVEAEPVLLGLDQAGVAVHSGSSCSSESLEPSPVLEAMGVDGERSLRLSVGWSTRDADVDAFVAAFPDVVGRLRSLSHRA